MNRLLWPMAAGFRVGIQLRGAAYRCGWLKTHRLRRPVVSVGNLTVGGTGKTPLVRLITERLLKRGWKPSILTRGYRRRRGPRIIALEPAAERAADPREVGEEPALLARWLPEVPIVIGAERYRAGCLAEERFDVDVHVLDDGFQHLALARNLDIVTLDATQELSEHALLPAGRLREPCSALARAQLVVLTRIELGDRETLEECVRGINPQANILRAETRLSALVDAETGSPYPPEALRDKPVAAFCGIGNPHAFMADLHRWGFQVVADSRFPDHHVYSPSELRWLEEGARQFGAAALLTTEKDTMNLPSAWKLTIPILACTARIEIVEADDFQQILVSCLEPASEECKRARTPAH